MDLFIIVTRRVIPGGTVSLYTWTLYEPGPKPLARAEDSWHSPSSAKNNAYKFLKRTGIKAKVRVV